MMEMDKIGAVEEELNEVAASLELSYNQRETTLDKENSIKRKLLPNSIHILETVCLCSANLVRIPKS